MAIQLLSVPTVVGGTTTGYPAIVNLIKNKINEVATVMNISLLTLNAALNAGSPADDLNTMASKVNELVNAVNNAAGSGSGGAGGTGTFPLKSGVDGNQRLVAVGTGAAITVAGGFTMGGKFTVQAFGAGFSDPQYFFANGDLGTGDESASLFATPDGNLVLRYKLSGSNAANEVVASGLIVQSSVYSLGLGASESGGNVNFLVGINGVTYPITKAGTLNRNTAPPTFGGVLVNGAPFSASVLGIDANMSYRNRRLTDSEMKVFTNGGCAMTQSDYEASEVPLYGPGLTETATSTTTANLADTAHPLTVTRFS